MFARPLLGCPISASSSFLRRTFSSRTYASNTSVLKRTMAYSIRESGAPNSTDYRMYFCGPNGPVSTFHDIPLFANAEKTLLNMVVEIPRWTCAKMEICTKEALNPIKQDVKKGKVRYVNSCFPYHGYIWNYGALPQTWEDPDHTDPDTQAKGDSDPIDACEIGTKVAKRGDVKQVKVLGTFAMIDEGETDWKVICIDVNDPLAANMNDISDVETYMPGLLKATVDWFKIYKVPAGKPLNQFAFNGDSQDKVFAMKVINETHESWKNLILKKKQNTLSLACKNVTVEGSPYKMTVGEATAIVDNAPPVGCPDPVPEDVDDWHYVSRS